MTTLGSGGAQHEVSAQSYFTDDEHFNKRLQDGVGASTLFADAMGTHRNQQEQRALNRGEIAAASSTSRKGSVAAIVGATSTNSSRPDTGGTTRGAAAFLQAQKVQQPQQGPGGTGTAAAAGGGGGVSPAQQHRGTSPHNTPGGNAARYLANFPQISLDDPTYSSTLAMLKKTRAELTQLSTELSASNMISDLPTSEDVRRIVAKIFADPRNAELISESEWKRREQAYVAQRDKLSTKINEHLQQEKAALAEEIKRLGIEQ